MLQEVPHGNRVERTVTERSVRKLAAVDLAAGSLPGLRRREGRHFNTSALPAPRLREAQEAARGASDIQERSGRAHVGFDDVEPRAEICDVRAFALARVRYAVMKEIAFPRGEVLLGVERLRRGLVPLRRQEHRLARRALEDLSHSGTQVPADFGRGTRGARHGRSPWFPPESQEAEMLPRRRAACTEKLEGVDACPNSGTFVLTSQGTRTYCCCARETERAKAGVCTAGRAITV
jgi:hypothetical protein